MRRMTGSITLGSTRKPVSPLPKWEKPKTKNPGGPDPAGPVPGGNLDPYPPERLLPRNGGAGLSAGITMQYVESPNH